MRKNQPLFLSTNGLIRMPSSCLALFWTPGLGWTLDIRLPGQAALDEAATVKGQETSSPAKPW